jgi:hypothetical protein
MKTFFLIAETQMKICRQTFNGALKSGKPRNLRSSVLWLLDGVCFNFKVSVSNSTGFNFVWMCRIYRHQALDGSEYFFFHQQTVVKQFGLYISAFLINQAIHSLCYFFA